MTQKEPGNARLLQLTQCFGGNKEYGQKYPKIFLLSGERFR